MRTAALLGALAVLAPLGLHVALRKHFPAPAAGAGVLVTGASSGIGRHAAVHLQHAGFTVFAGVRKQSDADSIAAEAPGIHPLILDVTKDELVAEAVEEVTRVLGGRPLAGLVNNAGVSKSLPLELQPMEQVRWIFDVNVLGTFAVSRAFMPLLREASGRIVNIGSTSGVIATPGKGVYSGAKWAMEGFTDAWRMELAHFGMSVSVVQPAYVRTEIAAKQTGANAPERSLSAEAQQLYGYLLDDADAKRLKAESAASPASVTTEAIVHALTDEYPRTRYAVANVNGVPAWLITAILPRLPDRARDAILLGALR